MEPHDSILYESDPLSDDDHHMTFEEFISCCRDGGFIDYDGYARYASKTHVYYGRTVSPSDILSGKYDKNYTHVVWYNK